MPKTKYFIRNGQIVTDATESERVASRLFKFPGTGQRLDGQPVEPEVETIPSMANATMTYSELVRQLDQKLGAPQGPVTKPFSGTGNRLDVPIMQRFHRYFCEAWANLQANQSAAQSGDSADQGTSSLPVLTPVEMGRICMVLPKPPVPYGYTRFDWDQAAFQEKVRSGRPDLLCDACKKLVSQCQYVQFDPKQLRKSTLKLEMVLSKIHSYFKQGDPEGNLEFLEEFGSLIQHLQALVKIWKRCLSQYYWAVSSTEEMLSLCILIPQRHDCLTGLSSNISSELENLKFCTGQTKIDEFLVLLPNLVRLRAVDLVLTEVLKRQGGRRLFIHSKCDFKMNANDLRIFSGRLAALGDGREPKGWLKKAFKPLHQHVAGYSENLIYSWQDGNLYIHGLVTWHLDDDMKGSERKISDEIQERGGNKEEFVEFFLWSASEVWTLGDLLKIEVVKLCEMGGVTPPVVVGKWDIVYLALTELLKGKF